MAPKKPSAFARAVNSSGGILFARFSMWAVLPVLGTLGGFIVSFYNDGKLFDLAQLTALSAINAQVSALCGGACPALPGIVAEIAGLRETQAAIDAAQDSRQEFRFARVEADVADIETRTRALEAWQRFVNRDDPAL